MIRTCLLAAALLAAPIAVEARQALPAPAPAHAAPPRAAVSQPISVVPAPVSRHEGLLHLRRNHTVTSFVASDARAFHPG